MMGLLTCALEFIEVTIPISLIRIIGRKTKFCKINYIMVMKNAKKHEKTSFILHF